MIVTHAIKSFCMIFKDFYLLLNFVNYNCRNWKNCQVRHIVLCFLLDEANNQFKKQLLILLLSVSRLFSEFWFHNCVGKTAHKFWPKCKLVAACFSCLLHRKPVYFLHKLNCKIIPQRLHRKNRQIVCLNL